MDSSGRILKNGRVLTCRRGVGLGRKLLHEAILEIRFMPCVRQIRIAAQCYAVGFYEKEGFRICSEEFLENGIPHVWTKLDSEEFPVE